MHHDAAGTTLTCTNPDCGCELTIVRPCPHGDTYTCACGHRLESVPGPGGPAAATAGRGAGRASLGERLEREGIVDQQAAVLDEIDEIEDPRR